MGPKLLKPDRLLREIANYHTSPSRKEDNKRPRKTEEKKRRVPKAALAKKLDEIVAEKRSAYNVKEDIEYLPVNKQNSLKENPFPCLRQNQKQNRCYQIDGAVSAAKQSHFALFWPMGYGKTLGGVLLTECALAQGRAEPEPIKRWVVVITKPSLIENFKTGLRQYGHSDEYIRNNYIFKGFDKAHQEIENQDKTLFRHMRDGILLIDEVHEIRNEHGVRTVNIEALAAIAWKIFVMTGTPLVNGPQDIYPILQLFALGNDKQLIHLEQAFPAGAESLKTDYPRLSKEQKQAMNDIMMNKVSFIDPKAPRDGFPERLKINVLLQMEPNFQKRYQQLEKDYIKKETKTDIKNTYHQFKYGTFSAESTAFYNQLRTALADINSRNNAKTRFVIHRIKENMDQKLTTTVFLPFIDKGVKVLRKVLECSAMLNEQRPIRIAVITGGETEKEKQTAVKAINAREVDVMIFSSAGATGIDLKGVSTHINWEPIWNAALEEQANARVIRFQSHAHLPIEQRIVTIYNLYYCKEEDMESYEMKMKNDASVDDVIVSGFSQSAVIVGDEDVGKTCYDEKANKSKENKDKARRDVKNKQKKRRGGVFSPSASKQKQLSRSQSDLSLHSFTSSSSSSSSSLSKSKSKSKEKDKTKQTYLASIDLLLYDFQVKKAALIERFTDEFVKHWAVESDTSVCAKERIARETILNGLNVRSKSKSKSKSRSKKSKSNRK